MDTHKGTFFFPPREISYMIHEKQEVRKKDSVTCSDIYLMKLGYILLGLPPLHKPGFFLDYASTVKMRSQNSNRYDCSSEMRLNAAQTD